MNYRFYYGKKINNSVSYIERILLFLFADDISIGI